MGDWPSTEVDITTMDTNSLLRCLGPRRTWSPETQAQLEAEADRRNLQWRSNTI